MTASRAADCRSQLSGAPSLSLRTTQWYSRGQANFYRRHSSYWGRKQIRWTASFFDQVQVVFNIITFLWKPVFEIFRQKSGIPGNSILNQILNINFHHQKCKEINDRFRSRRCFSWEEQTYKNETGNLRGKNPMIHFSKSSDFESLTMCSKNIHHVYTKLGPGEEWQVEIRITCLKMVRICLKNKHFSHSQIFFAILGVRYSV